MADDARTLGTRIGDARGRASMTQVELADAASLDRSALAKIETGARRVSALELARIAQALDMRIEWFFDDVPEAIVSHRSLDEPGTPSPIIDRQVEALARNVEFVQRMSTSLRLEVPPPLTRPDGAEQAEERAVEARALLGLAPHDPLLDIQSAASRVGVLVFSFDHGTDVADGASILLRQGAVALVNGDRRSGRRRLVVAHEIAHCLFADEYTVDWNVVEPVDPDVWEARLDRFARALLLPRIAVAARWHGLVESDGVRVAAVRVASEYRVDMATLARRLLEIGVVDAHDAAIVRRVRTTRADIVEYGLLVHEELVAPSLPNDYERAVLRLYRDDIVSAARATDLLFDVWDESELPEPPPLPAEAIWQFVI